MNSKTGRKRGLIFKAIRAMAFKHKTLTKLDISPPLTIQQANINLNTLVRKGELVRIKKAIRTGWRGEVIPAIYQRTPSLRRPELTNQHL